MIAIWRPMKLISDQMNWIWKLTFLLAVFWLGILISVIAGWQSQLGFSFFTARYALVASVTPLAVWLAVRWINTRGKAGD